MYCIGKHISNKYINYRPWIFGVFMKDEHLFHLIDFCKFPNAGIRRNITVITRNVRSMERDITDLFNLNRTLTEHSSTQSAASQAQMGMIKTTVERLERILGQYSKVSRAWDQLALN